jgi:hypothetical protein
MTDFDVLRSLPRFIQKFFEILSTNPKHDVYDMSLKQLKVFLDDYGRASCRSIKLDVEILNKILSFLNNKKFKTLDNSRILAITWLEEFLKYFKEDLEDKKLRGSIGDISVSNDTGDNKKLSNSLILNSSHFRRVIEQESSTKTLDKYSEPSIKNSHSGEKELTSKLFPDLLQCVLFYINTENDDIHDKIININEMLKELVIMVAKENSDLDNILS